LSTRRVEVGQGRGGGKHGGDRIRRDPEHDKDRERLRPPIPNVELMHVADF
jgi:hypothetical protein